MFRNLLVLAVLCLAAAASDASAQRTSSGDEHPSGVPLLSNAASAVSVRARLTKATAQASAALGKSGGFDDPAIRVALPPAMKKVESTLRSLGFGNAIDSVVAGMNRAGEAAALSAPSAFAPTIASLAVPARARYSDGAATKLLAVTSRPALAAALRPHVTNALVQSGTASRFGQLNAAYNKIATSPQNVDLTDHVTTAALSALLDRMATSEN